ALAADLEHASLREARHLGIAVRGVLGDDGKGGTRLIEVARNGELLCRNECLRSLELLVFLIALPQLESRDRDDDQRHGRNDVIAVLLPDLLEARAAYLLLDFAEDVAQCHILIWGPSAMDRNVQGIDRAR